jgi:2-hydroxychromene-2-carboxylate isomerase
MSDAFSSAAALTVCIDFKSPLAYLAKDPSYLLHQQFAIDIDWQPLLTSPIPLPQTASKGDDRGTRHRRYRAESATRDISRPAEVRNLKVDDIHTTADSSLAGIALLWVKQQAAEIQHRYIDLVFAGFWDGRLDIESQQAITALLQGCGAATEGLAGFIEGVGRTQFDQLQIELRQAGVFSVPAYLIQDEIFYGRQHLPMISWILSGRQGQTPI